MNGWGLKLSKMSYKINHDISDFYKPHISSAGDSLHKQKRIHDTLGEKGEKFHLTVGRDYICVLTW